MIFTCYVWFWDGIFCQMCRTRYIVSRALRFFINSIFYFCIIICIFSTTNCTVSKKKWWCIENKSNKKMWVDSSILLKSNFSIVWNISLSCYLQEKNTVFLVVRIFSKIKYLVIWELSLCFRFITSNYHCKFPTTRYLMQQIPTKIHYSNLSSSLICSSTFWYSVISLFFPVKLHLIPYTAISDVLQFR